MSHIIQNLVRRYPIISEQIEPRELAVILRECEKALTSAQGESSVVEFGCYEGTTSLFLQRLIMALRPEALLHVYDSFAGLPPKTAADKSAAGEQFKPGELKASKQAFVRHFKRAYVPLPVIHKAWFDELTPVDIPNRIIFAFLDGDYYESINDSLRLIEPKLQPNAIIVVDDYQNEALPGARRAVDEWVERRHLRLQAEASLAILRF
ncbi:MAG TPA: TylF/MycF/NovP-related O-methyltransferase [Candidatus Saccharimonadales bacterium]